MPVGKGLIRPEFDDAAIEGIRPARGGGTDIEITPDYGERRKRSMLAKCGMGLAPGPLGAIGAKGFFEVLECPPQCRCEDV